MSCNKKFAFTIKVKFR